MRRWCGEEVGLLRRRRVGERICGSSIMVCEVERS